MNEGMIKVSMFKMPFKTRHFNKNQKVWIRYRTGAAAAECVGKFRGKYRYVRAWVNWSHGNRPIPEFREIEVPEEFAKRLDLLYTAKAD